MADEVQYSSRTDHKRKFDDPVTTPPPSTLRRPTGFSSAPISSASPENHGSDGGAPPPSSCNSVPPPVDGIELAKQRAQEIAAKLFNDAEAKRPKIENSAGNVAFSDYVHKPLGQQMPSYAGITHTSSFNSYGYGETRKTIDIPNGRVGAIIGKGGETIKYLHTQSGGCKIQVTRDSDTDPNSQTRTVELSGSSEQISKAEKLISDVLSEAESGGSGIVTARKFVGAQVGGEQFSMKVPNNKVGLIIGKGGETIKNMQGSTGARIQIIPLHPPPGDTSTERTVQIDGTMEQIESAKQLVYEVISENRARNSQMGGGYSQQGYRLPRPPTNWAPPGPPTMQQPSYGYMQPGAYPGAPPQYNMSQPPYGSYPPQPASGWDQSSNPSTQQNTPGAGYDYYNQQQQQQQTQQQSLGTSSALADATSYNYGQPPVYSSQASYGDASYSQTATGQQQVYGQDAYAGGYSAQQSQTGASHPTPPNAQTGYDQGYGCGGTVANPGQDGSASTYTAPAGSAPTQQGYTSQPPSTAQTSYPSLTQPGYVQSPQAQKPPVIQAGYGQTPSGYAQPGTVQSGYGQPPPPSQPGYAQAYGQQVPAYGGAPPIQAGYGHQQQQYADAYGSGGYSQPPAYSSEGGAAAPTVPAGVTKASPRADNGK